MTAKDYQKKNILPDYLNFPAQKPYTVNPVAFVAYLFIALVLGVVLRGCI